MEYRIVSAHKEDAPYIGEAICMAIGDELVRHLAGNDHSAGDVRDLFSALAAREDTQYSYLNTVKAVDTEGNILGVAVGYDGALLHPLREAFISEAAKCIGLVFESAPADETDPGEYYLDTLAVFPQYRRNGIARRLIEAVKQRAQTINKPAGLLVSKTNAKARPLYESCGFKIVGERPFADEMMDHLQCI
ncbi:MAG: GNAT family N-acetyltransferase [Muribaculaceae bacterium]|nr:GNAT family N-acetyltransferase [Muribaculaceae bacterium]